ncbi:hypothetical protein ACFL0G_06065 [Candidatus Zixiibacteriota bacterium]
MIIVISWLIWGIRWKPGCNWFISRLNWRLGMNLADQQGIGVVGCRIAFSFDWPIDRVHKVVEGIVRPSGKRDVVLIPEHLPIRAGQLWHSDHLLHHVWIIHVP